LGLAKEPEFRGRIKDSLKRVSRDIRKAKEKLEADNRLEASDKISQIPADQKDKIRQAKKERWKAEQAAIKAERQARKEAKRREWEAECRRREAERQARCRR
jgi:hypothetical protein